MELSHAVLLSVVEGITEFLPISSTGHMILVSNLLGISSNDFVKNFEIIIQLGAISAVALLYWRKLLERKDLWPKLFVAFLPTAIIGKFFYPLIKDVLLESPIITLVSLFLGGVILIIIEKTKRESNGFEKVEDITFKQAVVVGLFQSIAIIPGVSRAAATIVGGLLLGGQRKAAVEFSFLLAIPTMLAATLYDLYKSDISTTDSELMLLGVGLVISCIVALLSIRFLLRIIQTNTFVPFGIYRIILAVVYFFLIIGI
jgi:undecaprenyl-diphosphatase